MEQFWHVTVNTGQIARVKFHCSELSKKLLPALCRLPGYVKLPGSLSDFSMRIYEADKEMGIFGIFRNSDNVRVPHSTCVYCTNDRYNLEDGPFEDLLNVYRNALENGDVEPQRSIIQKPSTPWLAVLRWKHSDPKITAPFERAVFDALVNGARNPVHQSDI